MAIREVEGGYYVEVFLGVDEITGKKVRKTKTFKPQNRENLKKAKTWEVKIQEQYENGELTPKGDMALSTFLDDWFETFIKGKKAYNTERRYNVFIDCIKAHLGQVRVNKLKTKMVDEFYNKMSKEMITLKNKTTKRRYMDGTILKTHKMFKLAMDQAVKWELVSKNVVTLASPPADDKRKIKFWDVKTINEFLEYIKDETIYLPVFIAYHTGLREGEISALRGKYDINLKKGYLTVNHNMVEKKGEGLVLEDTKTPASEAKVALTKELTFVLKSVLKEQKKHKLKNGVDLEYICCWDDGRPLRPTYISRTFTKFAKKFAEERGIDRITFHGLRHSHATILYSAGADSQEISKRLRHSRVSTTDDIYIHVTEEIKKSTAQIFDKAIDSSK
ncbi:tyrosine-type recombinase/integrase [Paratissierella segnis]|uniref:Site-specific integrase n=1 Tax=Paratissierella segnis TaxID=2763679 RepID=A0A926EUX9_9FIRM|nr:site-specific integrase [Paratissierella segnis]MBC8589376.1 site-specific integrase [Paratissierella segnis]